MDKIILGILMLHRMTAYELRNFIKNNFKSMYSDSLGSIQAALKKLFELEMVTFEELVEKGVNKKRYSITETGREALIEWIKIPINTSKTKNYDDIKPLEKFFENPKEIHKLLQLSDSELFKVLDFINLKDLLIYQVKLLNSSSNDIVFYKTYLNGVEHRGYKSKYFLTSKDFVFDSIEAAFDSNNIGRHIEYPNPKELKVSVDSKINIINS